MPVPRYDRADGRHRRLAALARTAQEAALGACNAGSAARRADVLRLLRDEGISAAIDDAVRPVLPEHAAAAGNE